MVESRQAEERAMAYVVQEVPQSIGTYFDDDNPLGPVAAEHINDNEVAAYLTSIENEAFHEISQGVSLLFGRKGAGKSSLLNSFHFPSQIRTTTRLSLGSSAKRQIISKDSDFRRPYDLIVQVDASKELDAVHSKVVKHGLPGPEIAADHWKKRLWLNVLVAVSRRPDIIDQVESNLRQQIIHFSRLTTRLASADNISNYLEEFAAAGDASLESLEIISAMLKGEFQRKSFSVLFIIDSIEEYNFDLDDSLSITIGGLVYIVGGKQEKGVFYKIAFPYEIYDQIQGHGNTGKTNLRSTTLNWTAGELVEITTRRMLLCLYVRENDKIENILKNYSAFQSTRRANFDFWESIFGGDIINEAHIPEPALYYALRHTQMLPRQVILSLSWLIRLSKTPRNSFMYINPDVISDATRQSCNILIGGLESGFKFTYPELQRALERFLPRCGIVSSYNELHRIYANSSVKSARNYTTEFYSFLRALIHVGVFGVIDDKAETDRYIEARFCYGDDTVLRSFEGRRFAMHPAFSLFYKEPEDRVKLGKAILPRGSFEEGQ